MSFNPDELLFIPLGGSEQFGANLNVYGYQGKFIAVDCGIGFADEYYPGVDILLPDPTFLEERRDDLAALIITHAHEDHIGATAHLWPRLKCPIICTEFTSVILKRKMKENPACKGARIRVVKQLEPFTAGGFVSTFLPVTHSIPQASSLLIETDLGTIFHSADWNNDPRPVIGDPIDGDAFSAIGDKGVLAYVGDSTNASVDGFSGSESDVELGLAEVFKECEQRIVVTMFASNIGRVRSICKAAEATGRKVAILGRSLHTMIGAAKECNILNDIEEFIDEKAIMAQPRDKVVVIATGSQGEGRAQIARIARGDQRSVKLEPEDTVIFSARPIPGNEKDIAFMQSRLVAAGVNIITPRSTKNIIHVSGHPNREEIKQMYDWIKPEIVIPVHGERSMIKDQAQLAQDCQVQQTVIPQNGSVIRIAPGKAEIIDHVGTGLLAVEPGRIVSSGHVAISERRKLHLSGAAHASVVIDAQGNLIARPQLSMVGLIDDKDEEDLEFLEDLKDEIEDMLGGLKRAKMTTDDMAEKIRISLRKDIYEVLRMKTKVSVHLTRI